MGASFFVVGTLASIVGRFSIGKDCKMAGFFSISAGFSIKMAGLLPISAR
ncbi:hypothetical protein [Rossellomorea sp. DUT-2]